MYSPSIQNLINLFSKFPTIGPRAAARFVFYLLNLSRKETDELISSIIALKKNIQICGFCFNSFESQNKNHLCEICSNPARDRTLICVVEKETDLTRLEATKKYKGLYFVLGGNTAGLKNEDLEKLRINQLKERIENPKKFGILDASFKEIILAVNPTAEGEATSLYLARHLKNYGKKITRLARGLPNGAELEYADEETLSSAFENRKPR